MYTMTDALSQATSLSALFATYANMNMAAVLAIVAFMLNNWEKDKHPLPLIFLGLGITAFLALNCRELYLIQHRIALRREAAHAYALANVDKIPPEFLRLLTEQPAIPPSWILVAFHVAVDLGLLVLLAFNYWHTKRTRLVGNAA